MAGGYVTRQIYNNDDISTGYEFTESKVVKRKILIIDNNGYNHEFICAGTLVYVRNVTNLDDVEGLIGLDIDDYTYNEESCYIPRHVKKRLYAVLGGNH